MMLLILDLNYSLLSNNFNRFSTVSQMKSICSLVKAAYIGK